MKRFRHIGIHFKYVLWSKPEFLIELFHFKDSNIVLNANLNVLNSNL